MVLWIPIPLKLTTEGIQVERSIASVIPRFTRNSGRFEAVSVATIAYSRLQKYCNKFSTLVPLDSSIPLIIQ